MVNQEALTKDLEEAIEEISRLRRALAKKERDNKILSRMKDYSENLNAFYEGEKKLQYLYNDLLISNCPNMIFLFDEGLHYVLGSDACRDVTDSDHKDLINKPFEKIFSFKVDADWVKKVHNHNRVTLETLGSFHYDDVIHHDSIGLMNVHVTISPIIDDYDNCKGTIMAITDVSELVEAKQRIEESAAEKMRFFANMSHEIRTPMNAILGISELMLSEDLNDKMAKYATDIRNSSESLLSLINDILDITKLESGKLSLIKVHYDFDMLIENIWSISNFLAMEKNISFRVNMADDVPNCLYGDDQRLRQILLNLINNAIKFTHKGMVTLSIKSTENELRMDVHDTGIGIKENDIEILFEAFKQADNTKNRKIKGTGLGLSISKNLAEAMGGRIEVESRYGEGSTFSLIIPKFLGDANLIEDKAESTLTFTAHDARVLIVDDNEVNLNVASGLIGLYNIQCDTALSGMESIDMLRAYDGYDIVFMDHMMPEMDGVDTTQMIRSMGGRLARIPIVALTANALVGTKELFLSSGMNDFLAKPIEKKKLAHMLIKWIPEEKLSITGFESKDRAAQPKRDIADAELISINDVDTAYGIANIGGSLEGYLSILSVFHREGIEKLPQIEEALEAGDLKLYTIYVHALKSSSGTIGSESVSALAKELETAGRTGDRYTIDKKHPLFIEKLKELLHSVGETIEDRKLVDDEPYDDGPKFDKLPSEIVENLVSALDMLDVPKVDAIMRDLNSRSWTDDATRNIEEISRLILTFDYDEAKTLIKKMSE